MDKTKVGWIKGGKWGWLGWGVVVGGKWRQQYLNNSKKKVKKKRNYSIMLKRSDKSSHFALFLTLVEKLSVFHLLVSCSMCVFHIGLLLCWKSFLIFLVCRMFFLIVKPYCSLSNAFCASVEVIILIFFYSVDVIYYVACHMLNHPWISGINPTQSWCIILVKCLWILFVSILSRVVTFNL